MGKRHASPFLSAFLVLLVAGLGLGAIYWTKPDPPRPFAPEPEPAPVHVRTLEAEERARQVRVYGESQPWRQALLAAESQGRVVWRAPGFESGGAVREGQVLLRLDPVARELALEAARASLTAAEAEILVRQAAVREASVSLANAAEQEEVRRLELDRQQKLLDAGDTSPAVRDQAHLLFLAAKGNRENLETRLASAEAMEKAAVAGRQQAAAVLAQRQDEWSRTELRAPFSGEISQPKVDLGDWVVPGTPVCLLVDRSRLRIQLSVPNEDCQDLGPDADFRVFFPTLEGPGTLNPEPGERGHRGKWIGLDPAAHSGSRSRRLSLELANADLRLPSGGFVEAILTQGTQLAVWLRPSEFRVESGRATAFVVASERQAQARELVFGRTLVDEEDRAWHPVLQGLQAGESLAIDNLEMVQDGGPVLVLEDERVSQPASQ
ncbi:MAG: HlyD family efflux transporter periplasmic adaptor subunit [Planctomycetota bacterium]|nr:MAG: HlyD family efflux transporter periplasmic adaptor subunit [Planctomycetota bacterium]